MFFNKNCCGGRQMQQMEQPIIEPTITKCVEKEFYHDVQHCCPMR